jgi:hypothetical protein
MEKQFKIYIKGVQNKAAIVPVFPWISVASGL